MWQVTAVWWCPDRLAPDQWTVDCRIRVCHTEQVAGTLADRWRSHGRVGGLKGPIRSFEVNVSELGSEER